VPGGGGGGGQAVAILGSSCQAGRPSCLECRAVPCPHPLLPACPYPHTLPTHSPTRAHSCLLMGVRQAISVSRGGDVRLEGCKSSCNNDPPAGRIKAVTG
jgi:hypothetical protein